MERKKVVMDTSGIIYLNDFSEFEEVVVPTNVVEEVKDRVSKLKLASIANLRVEEPKKESVEEVLKVAKESGDVSKLSETDVKVIALAYEKGYAVVSDDRNIQNVCSFLGLEFVPVFNPKIKKKVVWKKYCDVCKKVYDVSFQTCPVCGSKLRRIRWRESKL